MTSYKQKLLDWPVNDPVNKKNRYRKRFKTKEEIFPMFLESENCENGILVDHYPSKTA
jgi:adenylate kinase